MKKILTAVLTAMILPVMTWAQITISGTVTEQVTGDALAGATVNVTPSNFTATTDGKGRYTLGPLKPGTYTLKVTYVGYRSMQQRVELPASNVVNFALVPATILTEEVLVRATRASANAAVTFTEVDRKLIEKSNFGLDLPFLLDNTPGVVVTSDAGAGIGYTGIRIRGSDATRVNVTLNGIPYNDSESQGTFWVNMPDFASSVENIQIQRGVGTSTNGAGAFGGSLNIQTAAASTMPYVELNNTFGSFNTLKNTVKLGSGMVAERFSFEGRLSRIKSDGFIDRANSDLKSYFLSAAYHGKKDLLRVNIFSGTETTYQAWNGVPEARLNNDVAGMNDYIARNGLNTADAQNVLTSNGRRYNSFLYQDQTDNYWQNHYQALYGTQLGDKLSFNGALHYTSGRGYFEELKLDQRLSNYGLAPVIVGGTTISRSDLVRRRWLDNDFYGLTYNFLFKPSDKVALTLGGAYNQYEGDHFGQVIYATYGSNGNNDRHYYDNTGKKDDFNLYGKITLSPIAGLSVFADLQYRNIKYTIAGTDKNINQLNVNDQLGFFNPKFGLSYTFNAVHNIYTAFSIAGKEPNRDDYININQGVLPLKERLNNVEIGYRLNKNNLRLGVNAYGMYYDNQLVITGKINDVGEYYRQNVKESYRRGLEADVAYTFNKSFSILANAAFSQNKIRNFVAYTDDYDNGGQLQEVYARPDISFSPNTIAGGEFVYTPFSGLAVALLHKYVGRQYLDNTQTLARSLKSYQVTNLRLGYDFIFKGIKNINLGLLVNNVFNKKYETNGYTFGYFSGGARTTENFYFPQAGTNFLMSLNMKF